jgi:hypothetical protein
MTLEEQYAQRKVVLDAVAVEIRKMVDTTLDAGLEVASKTIMLPSPEGEWHIQMQVNTLQHFVVVAGHRHLDDPPEPEARSFLEYLTGGPPQDPMQFNFNCPIDWVPRADL